MTIKHGSAIAVVLAASCVSAPEPELVDDGVAMLAASCPFGHLRQVPVGSAAALRTALSNAVPGDLILLADGTYTGTFAAAVSGTAARRITLCGSRQAVLQGTSFQSARGILLTASFWTLAGFTITNSQKGVMVDGGHHNELVGLEVRNIGHEAVHFRKHSSDNLLRDSFIHDTGLANAGFGEAVYLGSAQSNWASVTGGQPDRADRNQVIGNTLGPNVTAEGIDIKEGTTGGVIRDNTFDGAGMSGANFADSWVDVKGNGYTIEGNHGQLSLRDGFQTHVILSGWGNHNTFAGNLADVSGPGFGFAVAGNSTGNIVRCNNTVTHASAGFANVSCQP